MVFDVRPGEWLDLTGGAKVQLIHKSGRAARLLVEAPRETTVKKNRPADVGHRPKHGLIKP